VSRIDGAKIKHGAKPGDHGATRRPQLVDGGWNASSRAECVVQPDQRDLCGDTFIDRLHRLRPVHIDENRLHRRIDPGQRGSSPLRGIVGEFRIHGDNLDPLLAELTRDELPGIEFSVLHTPDRYPFLSQEFLDELVVTVFAHSPGFYHRGTQMDKAKTR
jgi:hypothetical protein